MDDKFTGRANRFERLLELNAPQSVLQGEMYLLAKGMLGEGNSMPPEMGQLISRIEVKRANGMDASRELEEFFALVEENKHLDLE